MGEGMVGLRGATFERRLTVLIKMTDRLRNVRMLALISPLVERLFEAWRTEDVNLMDGVDTLRAFDTATWRPLIQLSTVRMAVYDGLIENADQVCSSGQLAELMSVLDLASDADGEVAGALRRAFDTYRRRNFSEDLIECRSTEQFDELLAHLDLFQSKLGVAADYEFAQAIETKEQFEQREEERAEGMSDIWRDQQSERRASESAVRDMFGSLRTGGD
jgi:hypothetical protein